MEWGIERQRERRGIASDKVTIIEVISRSIVGKVGVYCKNHSLSSKSSSSSLPMTIQCVKSSQVDDRGPKGVSIYGVVNISRVGWPCSVECVLTSDPEEGQFRPAVRSDWRDILVREDVAVQVRELDCASPGTLHPPHRFDLVGDEGGPDGCSVTRSVWRCSSDGEHLPSQLTAVD